MQIEEKNRIHQTWAELSINDVLLILQSMQFQISDRSIFFSKLN